MKKLTIRQSINHPTFHNVIRHVPHSGAHYAFTGFMDDFGMLVKLDFQKFAIALTN